MACDECSKCWFNYIEECEGQDNFRKDNCKKEKMKKEVVDEIEDKKVIVKAK